MPELESNHSEDTTDLNRRYDGRAKAAAFVAAIGIPLGAAAPVSAEAFSAASKAVPAAAHPERAPGKPLKVTPEQIKLSKDSSVRIFIKYADGKFHPWCTGTKNSPTKVLSAEHCFTEDEQGAEPDKSAKYNDFIANAKGKYFIQLPGPNKDMLPVTGLSLAHDSLGKDGFAMLKVSAPSEEAAASWKQVKELSTRELLKQPPLNSEMVWSGFSYKLASEITGFGHNAGTHMISSGFGDSRLMDVVLIKKWDKKIDMNGISGASAIGPNDFITGPHAVGYWFNSPSRGRR